jgi:hypothetical protein
MFGDENNLSFDDVIVKGIVNESGVAICIAPGHDVGQSSVYFSKYKKNWFGSVDLDWVSIVDHVRTSIDARLWA